MTCGRCARRATAPVAIGFQDLYDPTTHAVKRRLLDGAIGQPRAATVLACWPRDSSYYGRNAWAGAFRRDGVWVMDSPLSNAISHYANLALFWLGDAPAATAMPIAVDAELYRANLIENYDTCALRIHFAGGSELVVFFTHACQRQIDPQITITGTTGTLRMGEGRDIVLRDTHGTEVGRETITAERHAPMVRQFADWVRGEPGATVYATLEQAEAHLLVCNGASEATAIRDVPAEAIEVSSTGDGVTRRAIRGIEAAFEACAERGVLPSESGLLGWSEAAGRRDLRGYGGFTGPRGVRLPHPVAAATTLP